MASGRPNQAASRSGVQSSIPNPAPATTVPTTIPISGAQSWAAPREKSEISTMTTNVANATVGPAGDPGSMPAGTRTSMSVAMGNTVTASSRMTMPPTVGVIRRRNSESRAANRNCTSAELATRVASRGSPPTVAAAVQTAMNAPEVPM